MKKIDKTESGSISQDLWEKAKSQTLEKYARSNCLGALKQFFKDFEATQKTFYRSDLREFALESSIEDFISTEENTVFVSTIHKAKGREFDVVHLLLDEERYKKKDDEMLRVIYVGITRAKHALYIYNNTSFLNIQPSISHSLSMRDVFLDYFRNKKEKILNLQSGDKLTYNDGYLSLDGESIVYLSQSMRKRIKKLEEKGFFVSDAEVSYILAWRPRHEEEEIAVCLANLIFNKQHPKFIQDSN